MTTMDISVKDLQKYLGWFVDQNKANENKMVELAEYSDLYEIVSDVNNPHRQ